MIVDLKAMRIGAGFKQQDIGDRLGITQSQVSRYEKNPGAISLRLLTLWVSACGGRITIGYHCPEEIITVPGKWVTRELTPHKPGEP